MYRERPVARNVLCIISICVLYRNKQEYRWVQVILIDSVAVTAFEFNAIVVAIVTLCTEYDLNFLNYGFPFLLFFVFPKEIHDRYHPRII